MIPDSASNYDFCCAMMRLKALISGERWPEPDEQFDLVMAATLARLG